MPDGPLQPFALAMPEDIAAAANSQAMAAAGQGMIADGLALLAAGGDEELLDEAEAE